MANQVIIGALFQVGTSQVRLPYFNGQNFSHCKVPMEIYTNLAYDVKVWRVIKKGNYPLSAAAQPPADPEDIDSYTDEQIAVVQVNNKYEKISSCDTAEETWDKLKVTYEGTSKVKKTHINMLVHDHELFEIKEGESIEEMFARFSKIISDLKAFGKPYSSGDQVRKILRSLPTTWQTKVVTLESQDLNKLSYDELRGELITFEKTHLKKTNQEEKKKTVAFKATTEKAENDIDDDPEALQEEVAMVSRNMDGLMRRYKNARRGRMPPRRSRQYNEQDKNDGKCYECGRFGHVQAEWCWTDEDTSDDECKDDNENCFMARGDKNLFKEVTKIDGGSVKFGDDSKGKIVGTGTVPFNNNCDITEVYLVDGLNYNLLSISQLCDSGYEVKFKKTGCAIEDETESIHVIFDDNNTSAEKRIIASDEDQTQEIQETSKSQESTNKSDGVIESTNEISNGQLEFLKESTIHTIEPKKIEEALKDSSWLQAMQEKLDQFDKNQVWKLMPKPENAPSKENYSYLIGTVSHGLWYPRSNNFKLEGFSDADLAGDKEDKKSTSGTCQLLGKALISWNSKKQGSVALSITEAEYIAIGQCCA
ncbi:PREDICTED: uncharacterized protein LOC109225021 [Nicotiana attenuata]|uniref:uncharacterized protein LOC109225021 n=1 Tax=Nicotiana attenuata TaxID=49451 RepID=UPI000905D0B0|nr:PREDICTED: uncharacterized protein LOC109225021 [Nicotiana attenuata]